MSKINLGIIISIVIGIIIAFIGSYSIYKIYDNDKKLNEVIKFLNQATAQSQEQAPK